MNLNDGLPVWHASVSIQNPSSGPIHAPHESEMVAIRLLDGVGRDDGEWWVFSEGRVGHLRVGITKAELEVIWPDGDAPLATVDAGEHGPYRMRTRVG